MAHERVESEITGAVVMRWLGRPETMSIPIVRLDRPGVEVDRPRAYWIPTAWSDVLERLELHGIEIERIRGPREVTVEVDRIESFELEPTPFEGRVRVQVETVRERERRSFPAGTARVTTDQPLGDLAILLLEPGSPDSFLQWGFFHPIFQRTEYLEGYVGEPLAQRMLAADPALREAFERRLAEDADFAADPRARLEWFYERSPWYDRRYLVYPVTREVE